MFPTTDTGCADKELEPMVNKASIRTKRVDHSSFNSDSTFLTEESSEDTLLGVEATEATDWF